MNNMSRTTRSISKYRIEKMVKTAIAKRIKADDTGERDATCEAAMKEWDTVVKAAREFIDVYEKAIKSEDIKGVAKYDSDFTQVLDTSKSLYGDFLNSVWDTETAIRLVYQLGATSINKPIRSFKSSSRVGDVRTLSEFDIRDGDGHYHLTQGDGDVDMILEDAHVRGEYGYMYAVDLAKDGELLEIWVGNSMDDEEGFERVL